ncbi:MAG: winged helix DNA-binding domain-containing protein [Jatrophihabitans sp.]|nr:MAG: winged helix DNA-binding domain-containing protein [Jatrophihabitans sp.]
MLQRVRGHALGHHQADPVRGDQHADHHHQRDQQPAAPPPATADAGHVGHTLDPRIRHTAGMALPDPVLSERIVRHGFAARPARTVAGAAALVCGIQSQDARAARLGVRARSLGLTASDVDAAIARREVVRTWLMRNTIHLVPAADVRWLVALLGPMIRRRFETVRWPQLGLTAPVLAAATAAAPAVLAGRALTRHAFAAALRDRGVPVAAGQAATHVLVHLSAAGLVCRGADRGAQATFVLIDDWLAGSPEGPRDDEALAELARRYFAAFSPATPNDFTAWSGLPSSRAVTLVRDELRPVDVDGVAGYRLGAVEPQRCLRLLPAFDNYLVGYRRRPFVPADRYREVYAGGMIRPAVLLDGAVVGRWSLTPRRRVAPELFTALPGRARRLLDAEVADVEAFAAG